ncbi:prolyl-tRNA synthetase [Desulfitispora alkaliphila]|uniref:proline--tRNA ligase n=1 Tax=Desulfitispora alkaliphila TaxID=622674 RepID=UPI003D1997F3
MRVSQMFIPTLRQEPAEAEIISHKLMLRAGFIRKSSAGVYTYMPLGYKIIKKISEIVREEMDRANGQEVLLPIIQPAELWQETGRWDVYGDEMFRLKDRHNRDFCLGPTHEEIITDLVRGEVKSYKQLPMLLYQIQNKYRDERRPRFGLMRGREFIMKDLYSFDVDEAGLDISYKSMYQAYSNVFKRCGLEFSPVEADSGAMGGSTTHEFMAIADSGEAEIVYCKTCQYAANTEKAPCNDPQGEVIQSDQMKVLELVETPEVQSIEDVAEFLKVDKKDTVKTLVYEADEQLVLALVRGDRELNEVKLQNLLGASILEMADAGKVASEMGCEVGYLGPINKDIKVIADYEVKYLGNTVVGANKAGYHYVNANPARDFNVESYGDLRMIEKEDPCPKCGKELTFARGIEVGQVFKLGTKYSESLNAKYLDENGKEQLMVMGCYGIGVSRTMAAIIEQHYDENGIIWPVEIAPYKVVIVPVNEKDTEIVEFAEGLYTELTQSGIEVALDDRKERAGVKFKDADLVGYPLRITVGKTYKEYGEVEINIRRTGERITEKSEQVVSWVQAYLEDNK